MKPLPLHPDLIALAPRIIWFEPAERALSDPARFMAYLMTYGMPEDIKTVCEHIGNDVFVEALECMPAGIMDERSWAYWHVMAGKHAIPPLPTRRFPD